MATMRKKQGIWVVNTSEVSTRTVDAVAEMRRERLLHVLGSDKPIWRDENHPELADGSAAWVRKLRAEDDSLRSTTAGRKTKKNRKKR
ncbi:MAG: hypothetical protein LAO24_10635 [Acidobacteriia bacterium]|nr:hypothetical protein [Terriglobia bacterium]